MTKYVHVQTQPVSRMHAFAGPSWTSRTRARRRYELDHTTSTTRARDAAAERSSDRETSSSSSSSDSNRSDRSLVIKPRPATRQAGEPPRPVQIERTSSFLIQKSEQERREKYPEAASHDARRRADFDDELDFNDNPVGWVLRKTDQSLDAMENNIPSEAKDAITYVTGNLGTNASKVAIDAAKLAAKGGMKVAKAAVPAGTWVLSKGFGAIISVASSAAKAKKNNGNNGNNNGGGASKKKKNSK